MEDVFALRQFADQGAVGEGFDANDAVLRAVLV